MASENRITPAQRDQFLNDGYLMLRGLFDPEEMELLLAVSKADRALAAEAVSRGDGSGGTSRLALRNDLDDATIYSAIVRSHRVAGAMAELLGDEVYHYHHKMMLKEPRVGGAWQWHQDYGYWHAQSEAMGVASTRVTRSYTLQAIHGQNTARLRGMSRYVHPLPSLAQLTPQLVNNPA